MQKLCKQFGLKYDSVSTGVRGTIQVVKFYDKYDLYILNVNNKWKLIFSSLSLEQINFVLERIQFHNWWSRVAKEKTKKIQPLFARNLCDELSSLFYDKSNTKLRSVYHSFSRNEFSAFNGDLIIGANINFMGRDYFVEIYQFIHSLHSYHHSFSFIHDNTFIHNHSLSYYIIIHHYIFNSYNMIHDKIYTFIEDDRNIIMRAFQKFLEQNCVEDFPKIS